jgi:hypothetical protein
VNTLSRALPVDVRSRLTAHEFYAEYVNKKPVVMRGALADLPAAEKWSLDYLRSLAPDLPVRVKTGYLADGETVSYSLDEYADGVERWERRVVGATAEQRPGYLHDLPLIDLIPELRQDLEPFPTELFPPLFRREWWVFPQFFVGPSGAVTPLHFDTLLTHNLFFQLAGTKRFVMVDPRDRELCYTYKWRWSPIDVHAPDLERYPLFERARLQECVVEAGDLLYMPPGTLHQVTSLTSAVSFNIDWHDIVSARRGLTAIRHGMPLRNLRYNALFALGVWTRLPLKILMPGLKSYFFYIS